MKITAPSSFWDPLGMPPPSGDAAQRLADAEREAQQYAAKGSGPNSLPFFLAGGALFLFGGFIRDIIVLSLRLQMDTWVGIVLSLVPWGAAVVFFIIGCVFAGKQARAQAAAELVEKLRFAKARGWTVRTDVNRYAELAKAFPAFMSARGSSARVQQQWWGSCSSAEREYPLWLGELVCQVSTGGKSTTTEYSHIVGVRLPSMSPAAVSLVPEDLGHMFMHLFKGEYKTGNEAFDKAFNIGTGDAAQSSSALPSVLTPPFIAAVMAFRAKGGGKPRRVYVHRERDLLLVRFLNDSFQNHDPLLALKRLNDVISNAPVLPPDQRLERAVDELVTPVIELIDQARL
jgi:hypothetical protein